jgi:hypothetical protein
MPPLVPERRTTINYVPRPYQPGPPASQRSLPVMPPQNTPIFPLVSDLVKLIESQIAKISIAETLSVARCLSDEHGLVGNPYITGVNISRKNQEFSRGDSWFNVQWFVSEAPRQSMVARSISLRYEPGRQVCTSYSAEDRIVPYPSPQSQQAVPSQTSCPVHSPLKYDSPTAAASPMEIDPPKQMMDWSGLVGDLFDKAAGIVDDQKREKSQSVEERITIIKREETIPVVNEISSALWPLRAWQSITASIWGHQSSKPDNTVYTIEIPYIIKLA